MGQGRNNNDHCFYTFHQLGTFKLYPLFNYSNFNFHLDLLFILFKQIIVHIYTLDCLISLRLMSLPHFGPGSSSPYCCCCCCLYCCFCCCFVVVFVVVHQKLLHMSQVGESPSLWTWVHLTLGRKNLAAMTSTRLLLLRKVQVGLFFTLGLKLPRKGRLCQ